MHNGDEVVTPPQERQVASGGIQVLAILLTAMTFGWLEGQLASWPTWAFYPIELSLAFSVRFGLGIAYEKASQFPGEWKSLFWRVVCFESLTWAWSMVFFLSALDAGEHQDGWRWLLIAALVIFPLTMWSKRLVSKFRCPHCHQFFFEEKSIKEAKQLFPFALENWPNTQCQHCSWPIGKSEQTEGIL